MIAPISHILCGNRIRETTPDTVSALADSMAEVGLLNPVTVSKTTVVRNGRAQEGYVLIGGLHRIEAAKKLGWTEIAINVVDLDGYLAIIAECDENLCGTNLSLAERALFTTRRKEAYLELHPETKAGMAGATARWNANEKSAFAFTADTAARTGHSQRKVQIDARRGERIAPEVLASIAGTDLDTSKTLDELAAEPKEKQPAKVRQIAERKAAKPTSVTSATSAKEKWIADGVRWWNRGKKDWQEEFKNRIESPAFNRRTA